MGSRVESGDPGGRGTRLTSAQMARMSRLLDEALPLDDEMRRLWLEALSAEHEDIAAVLREALLRTGTGDRDAPATLPKMLAGQESTSVTASGLKPRARIGPYELIQLLGVGGMAEVWLARRADGAVKRDVALKLPQLTRWRDEFAQRFAREREILASLEHPHIARLYDVGGDSGGLPYLTMEYVQGEALTDWSEARQLSVRQRLDLFLQVLDAVHFAHERQIIHRDLKPSNILVTASGHAHLLDFGIAKLLADPNEQTQLTGLHGRAFTPDYASPEMLCGDPIDARSDVYSLGVILYELLTGMRPYDLRVAVSSGLLREAIAAVDIKKPSANARTGGATEKPRQNRGRQLRGDLDLITLKALAKDPRDRYQSVAEVAEDLRHYLRGEAVKVRRNSFWYQITQLVRRHPVAVGAPALAAAIVLAFSATWVLMRNALTGFLNVNSVVVLPFLDLSEKHDQAYFSDGLSEELINRLSQVPDLRVPARTSSFYFKDKAATIAEIAKTLGVAHVLEGSVRKSGNALRITAQLIRADTGYPEWSDTYDRPLDDVIKMQDEIASAVIKAMKVRLHLDQITRPAAATNSEAYVMRLQAAFFENRGTLEDAAKALEYHRQETVLDPNSASAWAEFSIALAKQYNYGLLPWPQAKAAAQQAADRALQLDPTNAVAHLATFRVHLQDWDWSLADSELQRAVQREPNAFPREQSRLAIAFGRLDDALHWTQIWVSTDPLNHRAYQQLSQVLWGIGRNAEAEAAIRKAIEISPTAIYPHSFLAEILAVRGAAGESLAELAREPDENNRALTAPFVYEALGRKADAAAALRQLLGATDTASVAIAAVYALRGDRDSAFAWLDRARTEHAGDLLYFQATDPEMKYMHRDPRWAGLLRKMNLPVEQVQ
jgi:eukaryotic-like serine/threonine-protein kinase